MNLGAITRCVVGKQGEGILGQHVNDPREETSELGGLGDDHVAVLAVAEVV